MEENYNKLRAQVLVDALPYIQKYNDKIVVVKYGGNAMTNEKLKQAVMSDIVLLSLVGVKVVLVHGGGPAGGPGGVFLCAGPSHPGAANSH